MANSKYEYVRHFETQDRCLPNCWIVVRLDGKNFHKFSDSHEFSKPNDEAALNLMNCCAVYVMNEFQDITVAYGESDEYSFVFRKGTTQFSRRASKLMTNVVSLFAASYVFNWSKFFPNKQLMYPPAFDCRVVVYPSDENLRDYLSWRQADCHINNLYNTCFWKLVLQGGYSTKEAEQKLKGTYSSDKNELLFSQFDINYNELPQLFRKGTVLFWQKVEEKLMKHFKSKDSERLETKEVTRVRNVVVTQHIDIIGDEFWKLHPEILGKAKS
ncbi:putative tRNA(His) guanylyltransferase [Saccoglossus kowalevskii]|uniref:tRNA(His) guanylyltransferase n=1 Tax=Saccoglossus kowalevskii TaxID=10224 RepID=A0ABM0M0Y9_SACKO|nr:PREDICTED: probable tRNA(His) guanylyltransferase-like [Saccoglossus kowalevskii]